MYMFFHGDIAYVLAPVLVDIYSMEVHVIVLA